MSWIFSNFQGITELTTQKEEKIESERRENRVRNIEYGRDSLEDIESHGGEI